MLDIPEFSEPFVRYSVRSESTERNLLEMLTLLTMAIYVRDYCNSGERVELLRDKANVKMNIYKRLKTELKQQHK